jgi:predicted HTH transcriptional regulator
LTGSAPVGTASASAELIDNDEDFAVEFKSTTRWDLRENQPSKAMEDAIVKTVAGFLNTDGGTLLIGIGRTPSRCTRETPSTKRAVAGRMHR